jgi:hypothetical protein
LSIREMAVMRKEEVMISYNEISNAVITNTYRCTDHAIERGMQRNIAIYRLIKSIPIHNYPYYFENDSLGCQSGKLIIRIKEEIEYRLVWGKSGRRITLITLFAYNPLMGIEANDKDYYCTFCDLAHWVA